MAGGRRRRLQRRRRGSCLARRGWAWLGRAWPGRAWPGWAWPGWAWPGWGCQRRRWWPQPPGESQRKSIVEQPEEVEKEGKKSPLAWSMDPSFPSSRVMSDCAAMKRGGKYQRVCTGDTLCSASQTRKSSNVERLDKRQHKCRRVDSMTHAA